MAKTNAERQKAWRERRNTLAKQTREGNSPSALPARTKLEDENEDLEMEVSALKREIMALKKRLQARGAEQLATEMAPLIKQLHEEGKKNATTACPANVRILATRLDRLFDEWNARRKQKR